MAENNVAISICICTYKRPESLSALLDAIGKLNIEDDFEVETVIVDNDRLMTAAAIVRGKIDSSRFPIIYIVEEVRNISLARNAAINNAKGEIIAFIDDDQTPDKNWLLNGVDAYRRAGSSGIVGPAVPVFADDVSPYVKDLSYFHKTRADGQSVTENEFHTGNVFLDARIFKRDNIFFDPAFGMTGGEDIDLFLRAHKMGHRFIWSENVIVFEKFGTNRTRASWFFKRGLRIGKVCCIQHMRDIGTWKKILFVITWIRYLAVGLVKLIASLLIGNKSLVIDRLMEVGIYSGFLFGWTNFWKDEYEQ